MDNLLKFSPHLPIPRHVAIIMDGNGRWAKERGLKRTEGHREGLNAVERVVKAAVEIGVEVLTIYAFSTENWKRPKSEIAYLMSLPKQLNDEVLPQLIENNVQVRHLGLRLGIPETTLMMIDRAINKTATNTGLILNVAFNYGSRMEIISACQAISNEVLSDKIKVEEIDETLFASYLKTGELGELADPDLLIRSSGELRLSNFLLWQLAYSEMLFVSEKWPDFDREVFLSCIGEYQRRNRRFGDIKS